MTDESAREHMTLADLNKAVTGAILRAEALPEGPERRQAYVEVSELEQRIAEKTEPHELEGEIARCGAVSAAVAARQYERALRLGAHYRPDVRQEVRAMLTTQMEIARQMLRTGTAFGG